MQQIPGASSSKVNVPRWSVAELVLTVDVLRVLPDGVSEPVSKGEWVHKRLSQGYRYSEEYFANG